MVSDRTVWRRLHECAGKGVTKKVLKATLDAHDRMLGLELEDWSWRTSRWTARSPRPSAAGRSPAGPGRPGQAGHQTLRGHDTLGIPLHLVAATANAHDSPLLAPTLARLPGAVGPLPDGARVHLEVGHDAGYDSTKTHGLLEVLGYRHAIASKGTPAPIQAGQRWSIERTHSWMNGYGKLRRSTDKAAAVAEVCLFLAAALTVIRRLINRSRARCRWDIRPTTRRLR